MRKRGWIVAAVLLLGAVLLTPGLRGTSTNGSAIAAETGDKAANFALPGTDGKLVRLSNLRGKVVVLSFWATWCPPCRMELPHLDALNKKYQRKPVAVLGVNLDLQGKELQNWLAKNKLTFKALSDKSGKTASAYQVEGIPTLLVIDQKGTIRHRAVGFDPNMEKNLSKLIDSLLTKKK